MSTVTEIPGVERDASQQVAGRAAETMLAPPAPQRRAPDRLVALFVACGLLIAALLATRIFIPAADTVTSSVSSRHLEPAP